VGGGTGLSSEIDLQQGFDNQNFNLNNLDIGILLVFGQLESTSC
jgi:hypothetical protein